MSIPPQTKVSTRRPLIGLSASVCVGVLLGLRGPLPIYPLIATAAVLWLIALSCFRSPKGQLWLYLAWLIASWSWGALAIANPSPRSLEKLGLVANTPVKIIGEVVSDPAACLPQSSGSSSIYVLQIEGALLADAWHRAIGNVRAFVPREESWPALEYGNKVVVDGKIDIAKDRRWAGDKQYTLRVRSLLVQNSERKRVGGTLRLIYRVRERCAQILRYGLEKYPEEAGVLQSIMLGYQGLPAQLRDVFATSGTLHIFAISGLHIVLIGWFIISVLKATGLSRISWILCAAPLIVMYTLLTGAASSAIRACIMALFYLVAPLLKRKPDTATAFALSAILILAIYPEQIVEVSFILSYAAVAGLLLFYPLLARKIRPIFEPDPWRLQKERAWIRLFRYIGGRLGDSAAVTVAASLTTTPLTAYYFNLFSPISLLANLLIVPGSSLVVFTGCLSIIFGAFSSHLAETLNLANLLFIKLLVMTAQTVKAVDWGYCYVQAPPVPLMLTWYALLFIPVIRTRWYTVLAAAVGSILLLVGLSQYYQQAKVIIDVPEIAMGRVAFIKATGSNCLLLNTGPGFCSASLLKYLHRHGVNRLRAIAFNRTEADQALALEAILKTIVVGEIWCVREIGGSKAGHDVLEVAQAYDVPIRFVEDGEQIAITKDVSWKTVTEKSNSTNEIVCPSYRSSKETAPQSARIQSVVDSTRPSYVLSCGNNVVLFAGCGKSLSRSLDGSATGAVVVGDRSLLIRSISKKLQSKQAKDVIVGGRIKRRSDSDLNEEGKPALRLWFTAHDGPRRIEWLGADHELLVAPASKDHAGLDRSAAIFWRAISFLSIKGTANCD